jgi:hypothetical protein
MAAHQMPFGGGLSPNVRGDFPTVLRYIRGIIIPKRHSLKCHP